MQLLLALVVSVVAAWVIGRASPAQPLPQFDHTGLRWRIHHGERFGGREIVGVVTTLLVLWGSWIEILAILWVVGGQRLGWWMIELPAIANLLAIVIVPVWLRASWSELRADPVQLVIRRPWPLGSRTLPWDTVTAIRTVGASLVVQTRSRRFVLDAPQAAPESVLAAAAWLEAGRHAPFPPPLPAEPAPPEMVSLVNRAGARSARRAAAE